jgi:hypothetical protein
VPENGVIDLSVMSSATQGGSAPAKPAPGAAAAAVRAAVAASAEAPEVTPLAVTPGTAILGTATIASLFSALWANIVPGPAAGTLAYQWSDPFTIQAFYADGSIMMFHGEARPVAPTVIKLS